MGRTTLIPALVSCADHPTPRRSFTQKASDRQGLGQESGRLIVATLRADQDRYEMPSSGHAWKDALGIVAAATVSRLEVRGARRAYEENREKVKWKNHQCVAQARMALANDDAGMRGASCVFCTSRRRFGSAASTRESARAAQTHSLHLFPRVSPCPTIVSASDAQKAPSACPSQASTATPAAGPSASSASFHRSPHHPVVDTKRRVPSRHAPFLSLRAPSIWVFLQPGAAPRPSGIRYGHAHIALCLARKLVARSSSRFLASVYNSSPLMTAMTTASQVNAQAPVCTLSYRHFHLLWTLPLCALLFLIAAPFLTKLDRAKLILLPIIAFVWTTPWDNIIVKNRAWSYHRHCIWFAIGYVPIEEYFFFIIQSLISTLWCTLLTRWHLPNLYLAPPADGRRRRSLATPTLVALIVPLLLGLRLAVPDTHSYYLGMISWWASLPLALLLWGSIDFIRNMPVRAGLLPFALSVLAPTAYLWCSDVYALRRGTWHINEATSLNIFPIPDLPVEEMLFFLVTNLILVSACYTFDRCVAICRQTAASDRPPLSPSYLPLATPSTYAELWNAFVRSDHRPHLITALSACVEPRDLSASLRVLRAASKSFNAASLLLPWDLRTDLGCLYAFCRVADDLVDDEAESVEAKSQNLEVVRRIVDAIYAESDTNAKPPNSADQPAVPISDRMRLLLASVALAESVKEDVRAAAASIAPLTHYIPKRLWYEMLEGYSTDLRFEHADVHKRTRLITMDDLVEYSQCVAGVVGEMCTRVILGRCGLAVPLDLHVDRKIVLGGIPVGGRNEKSSSLAGGAPAAKLDLSNPADMHALLYEARRMGVSLQLVNIARDVVPDALELRRCYLPTELFDEADSGMQEALLHGRLNVPEPSAAAAGKAVKSKAEQAKEAQAAVEPREVRKYALRLLAMSRRLYEQAYPALGQIPNRPARAGLKAACAVYAAIGTKIEAQTADDVASGRRARMSNRDRIVRAVAAVYFGV